MKKQITVRLPEDLVEFLDKVAEDDGGSRAAVITRALSRERRRAAAERDVEILANLGGHPHPDLEGLHAYVAEHLPELD